MPLRIWFRLTEILVSVILAITIFASWQADRRDRARLASQLAAAQQTITEAAARQHDRDTALNQTLEQLAAQKQSAVTTEQLLKALPSAISLPAPITLTAATSPASSRLVEKSAKVASTPSSRASTQASDAQSGQSDRTAPGAETSDSGDGKLRGLVLPTADLKPLYDFALDCKACQARLAASQNDLNDETTKNAALTRERDAAIRAAKGGSALRRIARAAKWFAIGAAAGAVAAKAAH